MSVLGISPVSSIQRACEQIAHHIIVNEVGGAGHVNNVNAICEMFRISRRNFYNLVKKLADDNIIEHLEGVIYITDYDRLKGFHLYQGCDRAIIRPEFVKAVRFGTEKRFQSLYAEGIVEQVAFRGNCLELQINVNGILLKTIQSFAEEPFQKGEKVEVIVYRLYAVDEKEAHLIQNEGLQENEMFYI